MLKMPTKVIVTCPSDRAREAIYAWGMQGAWAHCNIKIKTQGHARLCILRIHARLCIRARDIRLDTTYQDSFLYAGLQACYAYRALRGPFDSVIHC